MIYVIIGMSALFIGIGLLLNEKNAKYLLAGYNTMSAEERGKFDLKNFLPFYRNFHFFLGFSFSILGICLTYLISEDAGGVFLVSYPILAYVYFIWKSRKFSYPQSTKGSKAAIVVLVVVLIGVLGLLAYGFKENQMIFNEKQIEINGMYGKTIEANEIAVIQLLDSLPKISIKTNGYALGSIRKGYFKTKGGEIVHLILNSKNKPVILISPRTGRKIYFSAKKKSNKEIFRELQKTFPGIQ